MTEKLHPEVALHRIVRRLAGHLSSPIRWMVEFDDVQTPVGPGLHPR